MSPTSVHWTVNFTSFIINNFKMPFYNRFGANTVINKIQWWTFTPLKNLNKNIMNDEQNPNLELCRLSQQFDERKL